MLFRIQTTESGWIIEGGHVNRDGEFGVNYTDVATDEDQIGPIMNQFDFEEKDKEVQVEIQRKAAEATKPKKTTTVKKKVAKKKTTKKKPEIVEPPKLNNVQL